MFHAKFRIKNWKKDSRKCIILLQCKNFFFKEDFVRTPGGSPFGCGDLPLYISMFLRLFILFTLVPMIELAILIEIGSRVGTFHTIMLIIATGIVGALLAQSQGLAVIRKIQEEISFGRPPAAELFDGLFVLVGGVLLITPGIVTDIIGFIFLFPVTRNLIRQWLMRKIQSNISRGETNFTSINFFR